MTPSRFFTTTILSLSLTLAVLWHLTPVSIPEAQAAPLDRPMQDTLNVACTGGIGDTVDLIDKINQANLNGVDDTLILGTGCVYTLTSAYNADPDGYGPTGLPAIDTPITIDGNGATIKGITATFRIFYVTNTGDLTLDSLTLSDGLAQGKNGGRGNGAGGGSAGMGGAVFNRGQLTIQNSTLTGHQAIGGGGASTNTSFFGGGGGGGLGSGGSNASSSNFNGGNGGGVNGGNKGGGAGGEGGGGGGGTGGGTELGGQGGFGGGGGGGSDNQSVCAPSSCFNHGGDGGFGGGGGGSGSTNGQFTPGDGGFGADNGNDNGNGGDGAGLGGAIFNYSGNVTLVNSTFYNNTARQEDSANGYGGGLFNYNGAVTVTNVTFADNTAVGGGIYNYGASASLAMSNALLANTANSKDDCTNNNGTVSGSNNLIESNNGCGTPAVTTDPNLDSLADNGGDTQTMALPDGSSAIDQIASGSNGCGTTVTTDQRGLARPQNDACDIGAYEFLEAAMEIEGNGQAIANGDTTPTTDNDTDFGGTGRFNAITHIFTIHNNGGENLILSGSPAVSLADGTHFSVTQPATTTIRFSEGITFSLTFIPQSPGAFTDTVTIDNNDSDENPYTFVISGTGYCSDVIYVNQAATGNNNGSSWVDAYTDLQDGLALAELCTPVEVWVATGIYTPGLSRSDTFTLTSGIALYGGFAATETLRTERDWTANPTILSGDIDSNDTTDSNGVVTTTVHINGSNSYQVVYADGTGGTVITETTVLDGFTITAGQATAIIANRGGGFFCAGSGSGSECSPSLSNIIFSGNFAGSGGGMYNDGSSAGTSSPSLSNVTFFGNSATAGGGAIANIALSGGATIPSLTNVAFIGNSGDDGGAIFNWAYQGGSVSSPSLTNVTFSGNSADRGGAIYNRGSTGGSVSSPSLTNVTLSGNSANRGGALYSASASSGVSSPNLSNVILWGNTATLSGTQLYHDEATSVLNYTLIQSDTSAIYNENGGSVTDGLGNLTSDPLFADGPGADGLTGTLDDDLRLLPGSPAIDSGTNSGAPTEDLNGVGRPVNGTVDMGAYESQGFSLTISGGNNQSTLFDTAFAEPLQVIVSSAAGEPVGPGGVISFTAPGSGASLATASFTANTNSSGAALATVTANIFGGSYQVSATAAGVSSPVTFSLTNIGFVILGLEKKVELANSPATPGESITYTIVISNSGNEDAGAVTVQDTLPPGVSGADLSWTGLVTAGESLTFTIQATVTQEAGYGATVTNTASFSHSSGSGNDSASFSTVVSNLVLTKTVKLSNTPAHIGDAITYTLVLANNGTGEAANVSLQDTLPVGVSGSDFAETVTVLAGTAVTYTLKATVTAEAGYGNIVLNTATYSHASGSGSDAAGFSTIADTTAPIFGASPLITPTGGVELTGLRPTFDWEDATDSQSGVVSYTLLLTSSNNSLSLQETWTATTTASNFTPSADLATGSYTWTVRVHDAAGNVSAYVSPAASFEITTGSSGIPIYLPIISRK